MPSARETDALAAATAASSSARSAVSSTACAAGGGTLDQPARRGGQPGVVVAGLGRKPGLIGQLERGIRVIDVGCGRGQALNELAGWLPNSTFTGYDASEESVRYARDTAAARGLDNVRFHAADAARLGQIEGPDSADVEVHTFDDDPTSVFYVCRPSSRSRA